jgi:4-diphosphocytidyl-2-C-methyl-D-erythritol kinase
MRILSPSKINLYLHIVGKRPDGYHELETLMAPISLCDEMIVAVEGAGIQLTCSDPGLPVDAGNLAYKAADLFLKTYGLERGVRLHLDKKTPVGAGLGGGSGNAAAVLLALRELLKPEVSDAELAGLAAQIGSDVAFFIYRKPAICRGRGEQIEPVTLEGRWEGMLVHPGFGVSTPWAYKTYAAEPRQGTAGKTRNGVTLRNDLEPPVFGKYVWLPEAKQWFQRQPEVWDALMSGSGSSVFALVNEGAPVEDLRGRFHAEFGGDIFSVPFTVQH